MAHSTTPHGQISARQDSSNTSSPGAWLSIIGLMAWLVAMALAVAGPLLNIHIPAAMIVGIVIVSGVFSLLSLPRLLRSGEQDNNQ